MRKLHIQNNIGLLGEDIAVRYLNNNHFNIISRNYLENTGEIDIVAEKRGVLHFIEVKSVSCENLSNIDALAHNPIDNVHHRKLQRLYKTIELYKLRNEVPTAQSWEIDIASVYIALSLKKAAVRMMWNIIE